MESPYNYPRMRHTQSLYHGIAENPYKNTHNEHADHQHEQARADPESFSRGSSSDNLFSLFLVTNLQTGGGGGLTCFSMWYVPVILRKPSKRLKRAIIDPPSKRHGVVYSSIPKETQYTT